MATFNFSLLDTSNSTYVIDLFLLSHKNQFSDMIFFFFLVTNHRQKFPKDLSLEEIFLCNGLPALPISVGAETQDLFLARLPMKQSAQEKKSGQFRWRKMKSDTVDWLQKYPQFSTPTSSHALFNVILQPLSSRVSFPRPWSWVGFVTWVGLKNMVEVLCTSSKPASGGLVCFHALSFETVPLSQIPG